MQAFLLPNSNALNRAEKPSHSTCCNWLYDPQRMSEKGEIMVIGIYSKRYHIMFVAHIVTS